MQLLVLSTWVFAAIALAATSTSTARSRCHPFIPCSWPYFVVSHRHTITSDSASTPAPTVAPTSTPARATSKGNTSAPTPTEYHAPPPPPKPTKHHHAPKQRAPYSIYHATKPASTLKTSTKKQGVTSAPVASPSSAAPAGTTTGVRRACASPYPPACGNCAVM
jgi:hypothetical protein